MSIMVIACYRPKPGKDAALLALMKTHLPTLKREGLVGDGPSLFGKAADGTFVEVFCWKSQDAINAAHNNPAVQEMWNAFAGVADYVAIADVPEAKQMFSPFATVELA